MPLSSVPPLAEVVWHWPPVDALQPAFVIAPSDSTTLDPDMDEALSLLPGFRASPRASYRGHGQDLQQTLHRPASLTPIAEAREQQGVLRGLHDGRATLAQGRLLVARRLDRTTRCLAGGRALSFTVSGNVQHRRRCKRCCRPRPRYHVSNALDAVLCVWPGCHRSHCSSVLKGL